MRTSSLLLSSLTLVSTAVSQGAWIQLSPTASPPARAMCGCTSLDAHGQVLLFGGEVMNPGGATLGDTWLWDGATWQQPTPAATPRPLEGVAMTYDLLRDRAVMVPGWDQALQQYIGETWEWDQTAQNWINMMPATQPPPRDWSAIAYDPTNQNCVMFGGHDFRAAGGRLGDTWLWDGVNWTSSAASGPSARWGHAMVYDPVRNAVIMFGGAGAPASAGNEMWEWNGTGWSQITPATVPPPRRWHQMTFDPIRGSVVMVGGEWNGAFLADAWEWDGTDWRELCVAGAPAGGSLVGMAFDVVNQGLLQYGGSTIPDRGASTNETWVLASNATGYANWCTYGSGCGAGSGSSAYEQFTTGFDLANTSWSALPSQSSYVLLSLGNPIVMPSTPAVPFRDDETQPITLPWPFPRIDGTLTNDVWVCSNGWIALESTTSNDLSESVNDLLSGPMRIAALWDDLNPASGGSIHAEQDPNNPGQFHVTFLGVPEFSNTGANTFQVSFDMGGGFEVKYGTVSLQDTLVGFSPGNGALDPGGTDFSTVIPLGLQLNNDLPALALRSGGTRPVLGTTFTLEVTGIPPTATAAALLFSPTQFDPGVDLSPAGFGGCSLYVGLGFSAPLVLGGGATAQINLPLPSPSGLQGSSLFVQGAVVGVTNITPLPAGFTNGGEILIDAN